MTIPDYVGIMYEKGRANSTKRMEIFMEKKILGILGGMGPEATQVFYKKIIDCTQVDSDREHLDIFIYSHASIPDRTACILCGEEDRLWEIIKEDIQKLKFLGCEYLAIPCNTCHYFGEKLDILMDGKFINMIGETVAYINSQGLKKVGIMATDGTVQGDLYRKALEQYGIEAVYPSAEKQKDVMSLIYDQIKRGEKGDKHQFMGVVQELKEKGCQSVILACTELSVFNINYNLSSHYYVDALDVLTRVCIERCGGRYCD